MNQNMKWHEVWGWESGACMWDEIEEIGKLRGKPENFHIAHYNCPPSDTET